MSADKTHSPAGRIKKPDRVEGVAARRLLDALGPDTGQGRGTRVPRMPDGHLCPRRYLITGSPRYFHAQGTLGEPGEPNWTRDRQDAD
jgi:hypothetical protein